MDKRMKQYSEPSHKNGLAKIKVIGVGGGGGNAVTRMESQEINGVELYLVNTDQQALNNAKFGEDRKILIGRKSTNGLGAGANPDVGKKAATESIDELEEIIKDADMLFIAVGLGGGTGTGAAPIIAEIAKNKGILTVAVVTKPFAFEGPKRKKQAIAGYDSLSDIVDSIIVVPNDNLLATIGQNPINEAFQLADNILRQGVQSITDLMTIPAEINLDFADVKATLSNKGKALFGVGSAHGSKRASESAIQAVNSPFLESSIKGAKSAIVNITAGSDFTLMEANEVVNTISEQAGNEMDLIFGLATNDSFGDSCVVTIIATELEDEEDVLTKESIYNRPISQFSGLNQGYQKQADMVQIQKVRQNKFNYEDEDEDISEQDFFRKKQQAQPRKANFFGNR